MTRGYTVQISNLAASWSAEQAKTDAAFQLVLAAERAGLDPQDLETAFDRQSGVADDLADTIAGIPARTAGEAAAKFRILLQRYADGHGGFDQAEPIFAFLADLEELARCEAIAA